MVAMDKEVQTHRRVADQHGGIRAWWSRGHTGFLALLLLLNIVLDRFAFKPEGEMGTLFWAGVLLAQTFLMGFWMALGGLHVVQSAIAVAGTTAGGTLAFLMAIEAQQGAEWLQILLLSGTIVLATYVLLLPLRLLPSWRVEFDRVYHANICRGRMQLGLVDCINVLTSCAVLFGCARYLDRNLLPVAALGGGVALLNSLPIALAIVASRPSAKFWLLGAAVLGASLIAEYMTVVYALGEGPGLLFPFECGLVLTLLVNLLPLRFIFGLHLFSVAAGAEPAAELERGLAEVEAAWPTLPETIRARIVTLVRSASAAEPTSRARTRVPSPDEFANGDEQPEGNQPEEQVVNEHR